MSYADFMLTPSRVGRDDVVRDAKKLRPVRQPKPMDSSTIDEDALYKSIMERTMKTRALLAK